MRRVTQPELHFYDGLAGRINRSLSDPACVLTQSSLANRIGWHRASLCNFLNRTDKTIPAHFIPPMARAFHISIEALMGGITPSVPTLAARRTSWDPRTDDAEILIDKLREWRDRYLPGIRLHGHLPPVLLPRRGLIASYVDSIFDGGFPRAAGRWHDVIDAQARLMTEGGEGDVVNLIAYSDLLRLPNREYPFQNFSSDDVIYTLETLKKNWVRQRDLILIVVDDAAITPQARLALASNTSIGVVGQETRIEYGNNFCVRWTDDDAEGTRATHECLLQLKRSAGFGPRERPSVQEVEQLIDGLLQRIDAEGPAIPSPRRFVA
jgi:hypothetical protein